MGAPLIGAVSEVTAQYIHKVKSVLRAADRAGNDVICEGSHATDIKDRGQFPGILTGK